MKWVVRGVLVAINAALAVACLLTAAPSRVSAQGTTRPLAAASLVGFLPNTLTMSPALLALRAEMAPASPAPAWAPPAWHPGDLSMLVAVDGPVVATTGKAPKVRAPSGILFDLDRGEVLWARNADTPRTVASVTKLFSALALVSDQPDLDAKHCVTLEQWPSRPGARSKFETGSCHTGWEYLGAALVASDNRGAFTFPAIAEETYDTFITRMNDVAADLGASGASFVDPAGLEDENTASARDVLKAVLAASAHPELSIVASASEWQLDTDRGTRKLGTTNRLDGRYETLAAKTGYTDTAHYCFTTVVETRSGRHLAAAVLGSPTNSARFADVKALLDWAEQN
jgi:D-alanyl-D-alanine carboxypeptidase